LEIFISKVRFLIAKIFICIIRIYQYGISPLFPPSCRYQPTCSQYMIFAIKKEGPLKGVIIGLKRIITCHPWGGAPSED